MKMKKILFSLIASLIASISFADSIMIEGFESGNQDLGTPVGWTCDDSSWLCGYLEKDHNRIAHSGNWYAFTDADDSWMFMEFFMSDQLKYRYYFWAISDGEYDVEFWAGSGPSTDEMTTMLFSKTVNDGVYQRFDEYIDEVAEDYQYFGIHAIAHEGAYCLTIDDIEVHMVTKYEFIATPSEAYASLYPGQETVFSFKVQDLGYEPIDVIFSPSDEYFSNIHFTVDGTQCNVFHLEPNEAKKVVAEATLRPTAVPGSTCWLDIMLVLDCNCATSMTTLWVTVLDPAEIAEYTEKTTIFPNPTNDFASINVQGLQQVTVTDITGKRLIAMAAEHDNIRLDLSSLPAGIYFVTTLSAQGQTTQKLIKQ